MRRLRDDLPAPQPARPGEHAPGTRTCSATCSRVDDDGVLVRTRRGDVRVPAADIVLTKLVPPAPVAGADGDRRA